MKEAAQATKNGWTIRVHHYTYHPEKNGHSERNIDCPFCDTLTIARTWSLAGSGKRCGGCKAVHGYRGRSYIKTSDLTDSGK